MKIVIRESDFSEVWDGVFYKKLSNYPHITDWELKNVIDFIKYERLYGRDCPIECENQNILEKIDAALSNCQNFCSIKSPALIKECTACIQKGCDTRFVCHTTSEENAVKILQSGSLLSAVKSRCVSAEILKNEKRNAANDPTDYFDYVMFSWGNCQAGDRLVMERKLGRFPLEQDLAVPNFTPGIRFYFLYEKLLKHPDAVLDGVLPLKIKNKVTLSDWAEKIVIPFEIKSKMENYIPQNLKEKIVYIKNDCTDIWHWSNKVFKVISEPKNSENKNRGI